MTKVLLVRMGMLFTWLTPLLFIASLGIGLFLPSHSDYANTAYASSRQPQLSKIEADSLSRASYGNKYKVGKPYKVARRVYRPKEDYSYNKKGIASWYGPNFHGKPTAGGGRFNMHLVSGAHKTLPIPSIVEVTNLDNGRSAIVVITDRGPYSDNRIIDISRKGAELLGFIKNGTARVNVKILGAASQHIHQELKQGRKPNLLSALKDHGIGISPRASRSTNTTATQKNYGSSANYYVQSGSFGKARSAAGVRQALVNAGIIPTKVVRVKINGKNLYRVQSGPFSSQSQANAILRKAQKAGFKKSLVINQ